MIKQLRDLLKIFGKEKVAEQLKTNKSKLLIYDEFLNKYVTAEELLIPRGANKIESDLIISPKRSKELMLFDLFLNKFINPKLELFTLKYQIPMVCNKINQDNFSTSNTQFFWKNKKKGNKKHHIPALPPVHDSNKTSKLSGTGWAGQPTKWPESDPRPEPSYNEDPDKDNKKKKPPKKKQLKVCGQKHNKKGYVKGDSKSMETQSIELLEDNCHSLKSKSKQKLDTQQKMDSLDKYLSKCLRKKEKASVLKRCAQILSGKRCETKEKDSNQVSKSKSEKNIKTLDKSCKQNPLKIQSKDCCNISANNDKPSKHNESKSDKNCKQEIEDYNNPIVPSNLTKCNVTGTKVLQKIECEEKSDCGKKGSLPTRSHTLEDTNSTDMLCDIKCTTLQKKQLKESKSRSCNKPNKAEFCKKIPKSLNKLEDHNFSEDTCNQSCNSVLSIDQANLKECKKDLAEMAKSLCKQVLKKSESTNPFSTKESNKNITNSKDGKTNYNFMVVPNNKFFNSTANFNIEKGVDCEFKKVGLNVSTNYGTDKESSIKVGICKDNLFNKKHSINKSFGGKEICTNYEKYSCKDKEKVKDTLTDLETKECTKIAEDNKKDCQVISASNLINMKGLEYGLKIPKNKEYKKCKKIQKTMENGINESYRAKNTETRNKSKCHSIEQNITDKLDNISQQRAFEKAEPCKDIKAHQSDTYLGFKIKKSCSKENKHEKNCKKIKKTKSAPIPTTDNKCTKINLRSKQKTKSIVDSEISKTKYKPIKCKRINKSKQWLSKNKDRDQIPTKYVKGFKPKKNKTRGDLSDPTDPEKESCRDKNVMSTVIKPTTDLCKSIKIECDGDKTEKNACKNTMPINEICTDKILSSDIGKTSGDCCRGRNGSNTKYQSLLTTNPTHLISINEQKHQSKHSKNIRMKNSDEKTTKKSRAIKITNCKSSKAIKRLKQKRSAVICPMRNTKSTKTTSKLNISQSKKGSINNYKKGINYKKSIKSACSQEQIKESQNISQNVNQKPFTTTNPVLNQEKTCKQLKENKSEINQMKASNKCKSAIDITIVKEKKINNKKLLNRSISEQNLKIDKSCQPKRLNNTDPKITTNMIKDINDLKKVMIDNKTKDFTYFQSMSNKDKAAKSVNVLFDGLIKKDGGKLSLNKTSISEHNLKSNKKLFLNSETYSLLQGENHYKQNNFGNNLQISKTSLSNKNIKTSSFSDKAVALKDKTNVKENSLDIGANGLKCKCLNKSKSSINVVKLQSNNNIVQNIEKQRKDTNINTKEKINVIHTNNNLKEQITHKCNFINGQLPLNRGQSFRSKYQITAFETRPRTTGSIKQTKNILVGETRKSNTKEISKVKLNTNINIKNLTHSHKPQNCTETRVNNSKEAEILQGTSIKIINKAPNKIYPNYLGFSARVGAKSKTAESSLLRNSEQNVIPIKESDIFHSAIIKNQKNNKNNELKALLTNGSVDNKKYSEDKNSLTKPCRTPIKKTCKKEINNIQLETCNLLTSNKTGKIEFKTDNKFMLTEKGKIQLGKKVDFPKKVSFKENVVVKPRPTSEGMYFCDGKTKINNIKNGSLNKKPLKKTQYSGLTSGKTFILDKKLEINTKKNIPESNLTPKNTQNIENQYTDELKTNNSNSTCSKANNHFSKGVNSPRNFEKNHYGRITNAFGNKIIPKTIKQTKKTEELIDLKKMDKSCHVKKFTPIKRNTSNNKIDIKETKKVNKTINNDTNKAGGILEDNLRTTLRLYNNFVPSHHSLDLPKKENILKVKKRPKSKGSIHVPVNPPKM